MTVRPQVEIVAAGEFDGLAKRVKEVETNQAVMLRLDTSVPDIERYARRVRSLVERVEVLEHEVKAIMQSWKAHEAAVKRVEADIAAAHHRVEACEKGFEKLRCEVKPRKKPVWRKP